MKMSDYRAPQFDADHDTKLGWIKEVVAEGQNFVKGQNALADYDQAMRVISSLDSVVSEAPESISKISVNEAKRCAREIVATISNIKYGVSFKTDNPSMYGPGQYILNKMNNSWWFYTFADRKVRKAIQTGVVFGQAYISPLWKKNFWSRGRGDIDLEIYDANSVWPVQIPHNNDLQQAYAVTIGLNVPINLAHSMYPRYADLIKPTSGETSWMKKGLKAVQQYLSPVLNLGGKADSAGKDDYPTVEIYITYILDMTVNMTGKVLPMGEPNTSWQYDVPFLGMDIPSGMYDRNGSPLYRKAVEEDCYLYPLRRKIESCPTCIMKDGSSEWWHGKVPLVKVGFDDWPWEFHSFSLLRDIFSIQKSNDKIMRAMEDSITAKLRSPVAINEQSMSEQFSENFDPRIPGQQIRANLDMDPVPLRPLMPAEYYAIDPAAVNFVTSNEERIRHLTAIRDFTAIAKARQIPSSDSLEKMFEMAGPIVEDMCRNMEQPIVEMHDMWKCLFFQYVNAARRVQVLGSDGVTEEDYDYEPSNLIPSHLPGEDRDKQSLVARVERARWHMNNFITHMTAYSAHQITQLSRALTLLQLWKFKDFPIDPWSIAKNLNLENFGPEPEGATSMISRWIGWREMSRGLEIQMAQAAQQALQPGGAVPPIQENQPPGRPPTLENSPQIKSKDGGTRSTMATSR